MRQANICVVLAAMCLVAACSGTDSISRPSGLTGGGVLSDDTVSLTNIAGFPDLDFPSGVRCGYLTVFENRAKPDGRRNHRIRTQG